MKVAILDAPNLKINERSTGVLNLPEMNESQTNAIAAAAKTVVSTV